MSYEYYIELNGVTQSMLNMANCCSMKAHLRYMKGLVPKARIEGQALQFGSIFHEVLELAYPQISDVVENAYDVVNDICDTIKRGHKEVLHSTVSDMRQFEDLEVTVGLVRVTAQQYFCEYAKDYIEHDWVDFERTFKVKGPNGVPVNGVFDAIFKDSKGGFNLFETKTKSRIDESTMSDWLSINLQVMEYFWAVKEVYGKHPSSVLYNLVKRTALRQGKSESLTEYCNRVALDISSKPDDYFKRLSISATEEDVNSWYKTDFTEMIERLSRKPFRNSASCYQYFRPCEYLRTCAYNDYSYLTQLQTPFTELEDDNGS